MNTQLHADLIAARALIDTPEKWTKGANARNVMGESITFHAPEAVCFCMYGTTMRSLQLGPQPRPDREFEARAERTTNADNALRDAIIALWPCRYDGIAGFNDDHDTTYEMVLSVYDHAIAEASK